VAEIQSDDRLRRQRHAVMLALQPSASPDPAYLSEEGIAGVMASGGLVRMMSHERETIRDGQLRLRLLPPSEHFAVRDESATDGPLERSVQLEAKLASLTREVLPMFSGPSTISTLMLGC
jgi:hypothetical protein